MNIQFQSLMSFLDESVFLIIPTGISVSILLILSRWVILKFTKDFAEKTTVQWDNLIVAIIESLHPFFLGVIPSLGLFAYSAKYTEFASFSRPIFYILLGFYGFIIIRKVIRYITERVESVQGHEMLPSIVKTFTDIVLVVVIALVVLDRLGFSLSTIITGLGIGGIAIAFALQNILSDLFASISLYLDKPFKENDTVQLATGEVGKVKKVGLKTTRIATLSGEELVVNNQALSNGQISNYGRMKKRRVLFEVGVSLRTTPAQIEQVVTQITSIIDSVESAVTDRVHFASIEPERFRIEVVYHVMSGEYKLYMDIQESINLQILKYIHKKGIDLAIPVRRIQQDNA